MIFRRAYNLFLSPTKHYTRSIKVLVGFCPKNVSLYRKAFVHSSSAPGKHSNERLEMLGDSVLNFIVADYLFKKFPNKQEGFLTEMRSKMVSRSSMNEIAYDMGLQNFIQYNHSIKIIKDNDILGNALEALVGAIYLDCGFMITKKFILNKFIKGHIDVFQLEKIEYNFKSKILNWGQINRNTIEFKTDEEKRVGKRNFFVIGVYVNGALTASAQNFNKKQAEQAAAEEACKILEIK